MGQKVNPVGLRLGINRGWDSVWFSKKREYGKFLIEDYKIREYVKKNVVNSGVSQVLIERTSKKCIVSIYTSRPGFVIGKKGSDIDKIKKNLAKISSAEISLNIKEVKKPELNAYLVAENIAQQLVKRIAFRKTMKRAIQSALRLGAKGIKVCLSGRLAGNEIARTEWQREGSVPLHTFRADVDYAEAEALTTYGIIGVKVWIYKGEVFSKKTNINNKDKTNVLKAMEPERVISKQIEAARVALTRYMKRTGKVWLRIFPNIPVSKKPTEVRMGKGKGAPEFWACRVKPGRIIFEVDGIDEATAKIALYKASTKLPIKTKFIKRF